MNNKIPWEALCVISAVVSFLIGVNSAPASYVNVPQPVPSDKNIEDCLKQGGVFGASDRTAFDAGYVEYCHVEEKTFNY